MTKIINSLMTSSNKFPVFWFLVVVFFVIDFSIGLSILSIAIGVSLIFNLGNKIYFIKNLPYFILFSPALLSLKLGSFQLLFSDLLILFGGSYIIFNEILGKKIIKFNSKSTLIVGSFFLIFIYNFFQLAFFNAINEYANNKYYYYIICHVITFIVFLYTDINYIKKRLLLKSFLTSVFFATIIVLVYYYKGESLLAWSGGQYDKASDLNEFVFFRATYFYSGFFLYLGSSIALLGFLLFDKKNDFKIKVILLVAFLIEIIAALAFINKTLYVSLIGTFILTIFYKNRFNFLIFLKSLFFKLFSFCLGLTTLFFVIDFSPFERFIAYSTQTSSLDIRLFTYLNSLKLLVSEPFNFFFGKGLGFLSSSLPEKYEYTKNQYGGSEGTLDSQYFNIIIETGFIGTIILLTFMFFVVYRLLKFKQEKSKFVIIIFVIFSFISLTFLTQRMGMAKLSLILPILTALVVKHK